MATIGVISDIQKVDQYKQDIINLLEQREFDKLDCRADAARTHKDVFPNGIWKLHYIYSGLVEIKGHATEHDWTDRLAPLQQWIATKPPSIIAHVALAGAYITFAWDARGNGSSDTVTGNGWRLFNQRLEKAKSILDENSELNRKML